ncbi:MAG TPA: branched-chain amino acid ABC transporter permease [Stellaceae bacterium]|nr:branched-chain amino acid ABC transporter permease [Stellaceae bacterium]
MRAPFSSLFAGRPRRAPAALALFVAAMAAMPLVAGDYLLSVLILVLFAAYLAQAWNIMMGFAGLLSIGHALYIGIGAYASAALFVHYGTSPWIGMLAGVTIAALAGAAIGALSFRFKVGGVYFALLTIAFAEFTRILADHFGWIGASSGLFLPVANRATSDVWHLRGAPVMFYYLLLAAVLALLALGRLLLGRRIGYYWQAIREDEEAAKALGIDVFRCKLAAVTLSAGLTAVAGVFHAFYYNNLYPETIFAIGRSVELMLPAIIGGLGTLFGPILGAFLLTGLSEALTNATADWGIDGLKQLLYGLVLAIVVVLRPDGIWPWIAARLGLGAAPHPPASRVPPSARERSEGALPQGQP